MANIKMTPEDLRTAASIIDAKKGEIVTAVEEIKSKTDETTANWEGAAQSAFIVSFEEMYPTLHDTFPDTVAGIVSMLNGAADALEEADNSIASAFNGN